MRTVKRSYDPLQAVDVPERDVPVVMEETPRSTRLTV